MATEDVTYRVRVRLAEEDGQDRLVSIDQSPDSPEEVRKQWVERITEHIWAPASPGSLPGQAIRPWDFILVPDGAVASLPSPEGERDSGGTYPAHYRIPATSIDALGQQEQINRKERFAFGTLLYEIASGKKPLEGLSSEEVQQRYSNADFPEDVKGLPPPLFIAILSFWSVEFANTLNAPRSKFCQLTAGASSYIKAHPYLFALQVTGLLSFTVAAAAPAILAAVGFSALGPVAGSVATGWQASIGLVEAGSLFAWCQSAAMGGAAVNAVVATGAAGGGVAALATATAAAAQSATLDVEGVMKKFKEVYRRGTLREVEGKSMKA